MEFCTEIPNFIKIFGLVSLIGLSVFFVFKYFLDEMFMSGGLYIGTSVAWVSVISLCFAYLIFSLASYHNARKGIMNEF